MPKLTKIYVEKLEPQEADCIFWDDKISGFGVKVTPLGRKVYLLKYRNKEGRQRKPVIGIHGQITCENARDVAQDWLADIAKGKDPSMERSVSRKAPTVSELCERYMEEHSKLHKKENTLKLEKFYIKKFIKPMLGSLKTASVTKLDIAKFHSALRDTPSQANRILQTLSKMFSLAETWKIRPQHTNPVKGIQKYKEESRERFLTQEEIKRLNDVLDKAEHEGRESLYFLNLIRLLMLTGARLSEIQTAKWAWVDFSNGILNLPDSKTGKRTIYLSPSALDILVKTPKIEGNPYIIAGAKDSAPLNNATKPWYRIRKEAGLEDVRIHDLRHTFASLLIGQGFSLQMVAKLLGHGDTRMSERYAHLTKNSVQDAASSIGNLITNSRKAL